MKKSNAKILVKYIKYIKSYFTVKINLTFITHGKSKVKKK